MFNSYLKIFCNIRINGIKLNKNFECIKLRNKNWVLK